MKKKRVVVSIVLVLSLIIVSSGMFYLYNYYFSNYFSRGEIYGCNLINYCKASGEHYKFDSLKYKKVHPNEKPTILDSNIHNFKYIVNCSYSNVPCIYYYDYNDTSYCAGVAHIYQKVDTVNIKNNVIINKKIQNAPKSIEVSILDINELYVFDWVKLIKLDKNKVILNNVFNIHDNEYIIITPMIIVHITKKNVQYYIEI